MTRTSRATARFLEQLAEASARSRTSSTPSTPTIRSGQAALMRKAEVDAATIATVIRKMEESDGEH